jgi:hypothetical protein
MFGLFLYWGIGLFSSAKKTKNAKVGPPSDMGLPVVNKVMNSSK